MNDTVNISEWICNKSNSTGATCGAGTIYPSGVPVCIPLLQKGLCFSIFCFLCSSCKSSFVIFLLTIVLSVLLRITASWRYPFGALVSSNFSLSNQLIHIALIIIEAYQNAQWLYIIIICCRSRECFFETPIIKFL
jgi:hypothetical protein